MADLIDMMNAPPPPPPPPPPPSPPPPPDDDEPAWWAGESKLFREYKRWDKMNPHFYPLFERFTRQLINAGRSRLGVGLIWERIRWESMIQTEGDPWKLNDRYRSIYARRFMRDHPQHADIFRTRTLTALTEEEASRA